MCLLRLRIAAWVTTLILMPLTMNRPRARAAAAA
jgi:hypothetical protein